MRKDNMETIAATHQTLIKRILFLTLSGFFLTVVAVAFYDQDDAFLLRSRSVCQIRASIAGTINKIKIDSPPALKVVYLGVAWASPLWTPVVRKNASIFISSQAGAVCSNRAPPVRA